MSDLKLTELAAWWGAIVATIVLLWDIYKWKRSGPALQVSVTPDDIHTPGPRLQGGPYIAVTVVNVGGRRTTLTDLVAVYYPSLWLVLTRKFEMYYYLKPWGGERLPFELNPGSAWTGRFHQDNTVGNQVRDGYLYCGIKHTSSRKSVLRRVRISGIKRIQKTKAKGPWIVREIDPGPRSGT